MLEFRFFLCAFSRNQKSKAFLAVASKAIVVSTVPRYVKFKKQKLEGKNFKDLNSHEYQKEAMSFTLSIAVERMENLHR